MHQRQIQRDLKRLIKGDHIIKRAYEELNRVYWTEQETLQYEDMEKALEDNKAAFLFSVEEAEKKGRNGKEEKGASKKEKRRGASKKGEKQGKMEIAKQMLLKEFDLNMIQNLTGISKKQLEELK